MAVTNGKKTQPPAKRRKGAKEKKWKKGPHLPNALQKELQSLNPTDTNDQDIQSDDDIDVYEYEEKIPEEESKKNRRFDPVDNFEYQLPKDFEFLGPWFLGQLAILMIWCFCLFYVMAELRGSVVVSVLFWGFANQVACHFGLGSWSWYESGAPQDVRVYDLTYFLRVQRKEMDHHHVNTFNASEIMATICGCFRGK